MSTINIYECPPRSSINQLPLPYMADVMKAAADGQPVQIRTSSGRDFWLARIGNWPWRVIWSILITGAVCAGIATFIRFMVPHYQSAMTVSIMGLLTFCLLGMIGFYEDETNITSDNWNSPFKN